MPTSSQKPGWLDGKSHIFNPYRLCVVHPDSDNLFVTLKRRSCWCKRMILWWIVVSYTKPRPGIMKLVTSQWWILPERWSIFLLPPSLPLRFCSLPSLAAALCYNRFPRYHCAWPLLWFSGCNQGNDVLKNSCKLDQWWFYHCTLPHREETHGWKI